MSIEILSKNSKYSAKVAKVWCDLASNKVVSKSADSHEETTLPRSRPRSAASNSHRSARGAKKGQTDSDDDDSTAGATNSSMTSKEGVSAMKVTLLSQQATHMKTLLSCLDKVVAPLGMQCIHGVEAVHRPVSFYASWGVIDEDDVLAKSTDGRSSSAKAKIITAPNVSLDEVFEVVHGYVASYLLFGHDSTNGSSHPDSSRNNASASSRPMSAAELPSNEVLTQHQQAYLRVLKVLTQVLSYCHSRIQPLNDLRKAAGYQLDNVIREFTHTANTLSEAGKVTGTSSLARRNSVVSKAHQSRYEEALQAVRIAVLGVLHSYSKLREESASDLHPSHRLYDLEVLMSSSLDTTRGYLQERLAKLQRTMRASLPQQLQAALLSLPLSGGSYFTGPCDVEVPAAFALPILPRDIPDICATPFLLHSRVLEFLSNTEDTTILPSQHQYLISGIRIYLSTLDVGGSGKSRHDVVPSEVAEDEHSYPSTLMQMDVDVQDAPPGTQGFRLLKPLHTVSKVREPSQSVQRPLSSQGRGKLLAPISHQHRDAGSGDDSVDDVDMRGTYPPNKHVAAPYLVHGGKGRKGSRGGVVVQRLIDYRASRARCPEALSKAHQLEVCALRIQLWWALASRIRRMNAEAAIFITRRHSSVVSALDVNGIIQAPTETEVLEDEALREYEDNVEWCRMRQDDLLRENDEREQRAIRMQNDSAAVIQRFLGSICQCREPRRQLREMSAHRRKKHAISTIETWWSVFLPGRRKDRESRQCRSGSQREFHSRQRLAVAQHKDTWDRIVLSVVLLQSCGRGYHIRSSRRTTDNNPTLKELRYYYFVVRRDAMASRYGRRWLALTRSRRQRQLVHTQRSVPMLADATVTAAIKISKVVRGFISRCRYAHLQIRERIQEGNFRRAVASSRVDPTVTIPAFPQKMRIAAGRIVRFILRRWSQRAVLTQRAGSISSKQAVAIASRKAFAVLTIQNTLYRGILMAKKERHRRRMLRDEAALRKELEELESQNTVGSLYRHHLSTKGSDLTEDKIACRAGGISTIPLPRPQSGHSRPGSASLVDSMSVRARYEHMKVEGDITEEALEEMEVEPIATSEVMRRHLKRIQRIDSSIVPPITFPLPKSESKTEAPFMQSLIEHLMDHCSHVLLYVLRVALCADLHSNAHDHNNLHKQLKSTPKGDLPARHSIRLLESLRELGQDQLDRQWLSVFDDDDDIGELDYSCTGTDMPLPTNPSLASQWVSRGKPSSAPSAQPIVEPPQTLMFIPTIECAWSNAAALAVEISEHAAVVGWRAIFSRTTYDLYKQNVVAEDKCEKRERFQRVYVDRNLCIQSCYRVSSEEKWLVEVSKDIRKAGEVYKPARPDIDADENDIEERRLSAFYFTFDFITQCFPRVFEDTSRDANECLSENLPAYLVVLAIQHLVAAKLCTPGGEEFGYALSSLLPKMEIPCPDTDSDESSNSISGNPTVDLGVRLVMFLFGDSHGNGDDGSTSNRGLASMFKGKPFVHKSLLEEHPLD